jgi:acyl carrier protein
MTNLLKTGEKIVLQPCRIPKELFSKEEVMQANTDKIRAFIFSNFLFDTDESALDNDASFLEQGIIDSTGVLELVEWLEETFSIKVEDEELIPENLDSVNRLGQFIVRKTS